MVDVGDDVDASAALHLVTVLDDDATPEVSFVAASSSAGEGAGAASVEVALSAASGLPVTVEFLPSGDAVEGVDYALGSASPLVIAAGQTSAQIPITLLDDGLDEADETVVLTLGAATDATVGAVGAHTLSILDDDAQPTVGFDLAAASAGEAHPAICSPTGASLCRLDAIFFISVRTLVSMAWLATISLITKPPPAAQSWASMGEAAHYPNSKSKLIAAHSASPIFSRRIDVVQIFSK